MDLPFERFVPYIAVMLGGLVISVVLGYVAFFNSKRPPGWENAERPNFIPKVGEDPGSET